MNETLQSQNELLLTGQPVLVLVGLIACGMACCFFGYRTAGFLLDLSGFIFLGLVALLVTGAISQGNLLVMLVALVAGGLIGALLAHLVYRLGIMLLGGGVGALTFWHFAAALPSPQWLLPGAVVAGILGGLLALLLQRVVISLATAVLGGLFVVHGVFMLLEQYGVTPVMPEAGETLGSVAPFALAWAGITATGFLFQMLFSRPGRASATR